MSKFISLFKYFDKLKGSNNYKVWSRHIQSTLIYNELWKGIYNEQTTKPIDSTPLEKWELKYENSLALIQSIISDEVFVHIENCIDSWSARKTLKYLFDSQNEAKRVDIKLNLLQ